MQLILSIILLVIEVVALVQGLRNYSYLRTTPEKYLVYFMILVVLVEIPAFVMTNYGINASPLYNMYMLLSFAIFFVWFYHILRHRYVVIGLGVVFMLGYIIAFITQDFYYSLLSYALATGTIAILILVFMLYLDMLKADYVIEYKDSRRFWIATGLLLFHIGFLPIIFFQGFVDVYGVEYNLVLTMLNLIVYGCIIKAFSCIKT